MLIWLMFSGCSSGQDESEPSEAPPQGHDQGGGEPEAGNTCQHQDPRLAKASTHRLMVVVDTPGTYSLLPVAKSTWDPLPIISVSPLGFPPDKVPVNLGDLIRVYECRANGWVYLGDLDITAFTAAGTQADHLGRQPPVPWVATGYLVQPKH